LDDGDIMGEEKSENIEDPTLTWTGVKKCAVVMSHSQAEEHSEAEGR
jgi:hypothetical protein